MDVKCDIKDTPTERKKDIYQDDFCLVVLFVFYRNITLQFRSKYQKHIHKFVRTVRPLINKDIYDGKITETKYH